MKGNALAFAVLALGLATAAPAEDGLDAFENGYQDGDFGRIRHLENGATVLRPGSDDAGRFGDGPPSANTPIFPGDSIRTGRDQRVEVQLADGTVLRLDRDGELVFQALPRPEAEYRDNTVLSLGVGTVRVASRASDDEEFRVDTPSSSVYPLGEADVRIDVDRGGVTRVLSRRGVVEVVGEGGSVLLRGGMGTAVEPGYVPSDPRAFRTAAGDDFDSWCDGRDRSLAPRDPVASGASRGTYETLPYEVRPYYGELSAHGSWAYVPTYGHVWHPSAVDAGWRPYWDGYWGYGPSGYFWIASEPWGWAPYHYGRWAWIVGFGWCWVPGSVFGGAWVSWSWSSLYVGWAPLDYWNYPCVGPTSYRGYYDPHSWTFVHYDRFANTRPYARYAVPVSSVLPSHGGAAIVTRPPRVSPTAYATSADARHRAARHAAEDRAARLPAAGASHTRTTDRKFVVGERRMLENRGRSQDPTALRSDPARRRTAESAAPRPSAPGVARPAPSAGRQGSRSPAARSGGEAERGRDTARQPTGGFPRRTKSEPAVVERRETRAVQPDGRTLREERSATRDHLRNMYDRLASPRETRPRQEARDVRPARPEAASRTQRAERSEPPAAPRARTREPQPQPQRAEPKSPRQRSEASSRAGGQKEKGKPAQSRGEKTRKR